jgi:hypothetical protein
VLVAGIQTLLDTIAEQPSFQPGDPPGIREPGQPSVREEEARHIDERIPPDRERPKLHQYRVEGMHEGHRRETRAGCFTTGRQSRSSMSFSIGRSRVSKLSSRPSPPVGSRTTSFSNGPSASSWDGLNASGGET